MSLQERYEKMMGRPMPDSAVPQSQSFGFGEKFDPNARTSRDASINADGSVSVGGIVVATALPRPAGIKLAVAAADAQQASSLSPGKQGPRSHR